MTKNRTPTPVHLDPGMHSGLEVKGLSIIFFQIEHRCQELTCLSPTETYLLTYDPTL